MLTSILLSSNMLASVITQVFVKISVPTVCVEMTQFLIRHCFIQQILLNQLLRSQKYRIKSKTTKHSRTQTSVFTSLLLVKLIFQCVSEFIGLVY